MEIGLPVAREAHTNFDGSFLHRATVRPFLCKKDRNIGADHAVGGRPSAIASTSAAEIPMTRSSTKSSAEKS